LPIPHVANWAICFFACGVSAYSAGIFHLTTHAFFKALLFLGAGSVIHALSDEQDIRKMGGLWKKIPFTYCVMWIGSLALAGIYPFAGYFSKDIILEAAYASDTLCGHVAYWMGLCAALFTAFYSWRLIILTFHGNPRASDEVMDHVHESPLSMTIPLFLLATGSVITGYIGYHYLGVVEYESPFWSGVLHTLSQHNTLDAVHHVPEWVALAPLIAGLTGILIAYTMYMFNPTLPQFIYHRTQRLYNILLNKWYFDEFYDLILVRFSKRLGKFCWRKADMVFIDGMPNGMASLSALMARAISIVQSGFIYHYAFAMLFGLLCILSWALLLMK
jgi:NADH-quinone oxidoreductase subunit L